MVGTSPTPTEAKVVAEVGPTSGAEQPANSVEAVSGKTFVAVYRAHVCMCSLVTSKSTANLCRDENGLAALDH